jgi:hypothetical protein
LRQRTRILSNLESLYRAAFEEAEIASDSMRMSKLDFAFQRDQLLFEILLDIREAFSAPSVETEDSESLLDKAEKLRRITRLR